MRLFLAALLTFSICQQSLAAEPVDLYRSIIEGRLDSVSDFIANGGDIKEHIEAPMGSVTPLKVALYDREEEIAILLLNSGAIRPAVQIAKRAMTPRNDEGKTD